MTKQWTKEQRGAAAERARLRWSKIPPDERKEIAKTMRAGYKEDSIERMAATQRSRFANNPKLREKTAAELKSYKQTEKYKEAKSAGLMGHIVTDETKEKIRLYAINQTDGHKQKNSQAHLGNQYGKGNKGKKRTPEMNEKRAELTAQMHEEGRFPTAFTKIELALAEFLIDSGYDLIPQVQFGRYPVDLYEPNYHLAFEADGRYFHDRKEFFSPGYFKQRDEYLLSKYNLTTIRFSEAEIWGITQKTPHSIKFAYPAGSFRGEKTHFAKCGHPRTEDNLYKSSQGIRVYCKICLANGSRKAPWMIDNSFASKK